MIRAVIVDDQPLVRMGLRTLIDSEVDVELVGEASDGAQGVALVNSTTPDVVLMDIRMPGLDGLNALREITANEQLSHVHVIMLTTFEMDDYVFESLRGGASAFVLKDAEPAELLRAIHVVADGGSLLSPSVTRTVIERFAGSTASSTPHPQLHTLTVREIEIVRWVATGKSNDEIAGELYLSPATVRTHVSRAMTKLHARDRAQLVVFAVESGLGS